MEVQLSELVAITDITKDGQDRLRADDPSELCNAAYLIETV